jgi:hypothetical protein
LHLVPSMISLILTSVPVPAATTMLHCGDGILGVMRGVGFAPDIAFSLMAKKLNFNLIWSDYLLPYVWGVSHMLFGKHQTPWSARLNMVLLTDTPISAMGALQLLQGYLWSLCFGGRPSLGRFVVVPYSFHFLIMDWMVLCGMFKVSDIFL